MYDDVRSLIMILVEMYRESNEMTSYFNLGTFYKRKDIPLDKIMLFDIPKAVRKQLIDGYRRFGVQSYIYA